MVTNYKTLICQMLKTLPKVVSTFVCVLQNAQTKPKCKSICYANVFLLNLYNAFTKSILCRALYSFPKLKKP